MIFLSFEIMQLSNIIALKKYNLYFKTETTIILLFYYYCKSWVLVG